MRELKPYRSLDELRQAFDNGGQIFNLFSKAGDSVVTGDELSKAAGVFSAGVNAFLFLEMSQQALSDDDRKMVPSLLNPRLRSMYEELKPPTLQPSLVATKGIPGHPLIVTGLVRRAADQSQFSGFIKIPIPGGTKDNNFAEIPILDHFDFYHVYDSSVTEESGAVVTTDRGETLEEGAQIRFGGMLRKLYFRGQPSQADPTVYLETVFYTLL